MGNLRSVEKALSYLGFPAIVTSQPQEIKQAGKLILPGVGAFGDAMQELGQRNLIAVIKDSVQEGRALLGICLGLQVLFDKSEEAPEVPGLGLIPGEVRRFKTKLKVPHMGWNRIKMQQPCPLLDSISNESYFYFVHSYYVKPNDNEVIVALTDYDGDFVSMIQRGNLFATQFHPEKSQQWGLKILRNFGELKP